MRISDWSSDVCSSDLDEIVALGIKILEILGVEADLLDRVGAAETVVQLAPVDQILGLHLHIGAALARLSVLDLGNLPDTAFIFDNIAGTDFNAGDFHRAHSLQQGWKEPPASERAPVKIGKANV